MRLDAALAFAAALALTGCPAQRADAPAEAPPAPSPAPSSPGAESPPAPPPTAAGLGYFSEGGVRFEVKAIVPVWNAEAGELKLVALPFEPSPEERLRCQQDEVFFMLMDRGDTLPGFPDRTPYAHVALSWPFDASDVGKAEKASVHVYLCGVGEKGSNMNVSRMQGEGVTLSGELAAGSEVEVHAAGETD
ncbi:MAG: hypothetical protein KDD82_20740, partial [Planctomycetes bacterium]|nr:hypothetical protein [Planctomycetota bacterium]